MKIIEINRGLTLTRARFFGGLIAGLLFAISFYLLLNITRETIRIMSQTNTHDLWVLSDSELNFYNLIYALISTIIGQTICFVVWFDKPRGFLNRKSLILKSVVNDQRNLTWFFILWFTKLAFLYGVFFGLALSGGYYVISLYDQFYYLFILFVIVLFLNSWLSLNRVLKSNKVKWFLTSLLAVIVISVLISRINPIDFAAVNEKILDKNISKKYDFELPSSSRGERVRNAYSIWDIYVVIDSFSTNQVNTKLLFQDSIIEFDELTESIVNKRNENDSWEILQFTYKLNIDKRVQMVWVNQVIKTLTQQQYRKFWFSVLPMKMEYDPGYYNLNGIPFKFPSFDPPSLDLETFNSQIDNFITIEQMANDSFKFNDESISTLNINDSLEKYLSANPIIKFYVNDEATYNSFIFMVTAIRETMHNLRNDYSMNEYQKAYDDLERFERKAVKKKFIERIFVITDEMNQILKSEEDL